MSESGNGALVWKPRHRGWNLAHHLLPTFLLIAFLGAAGSYALIHAKPVLSTALLASAAALLLVVISAFRRPTTDYPVQNFAVETSTGQRAATWFPVFRGSAILAALLVGLSVIVLVASLALSARFLFLHTSTPVALTAALGLALVGCGVYLLSRGLRMARIVATAQNPGIYLTRSRIVHYGSRGMREIYWNDVVGIEATDPPGRKPLGKRGPAWIVIRCGADGTTTTSRMSLGASGGITMVVQVHELSASPNLLLGTLEHYLEHPEQRADLGTESALMTISGLGQQT